MASKKLSSEITSNLLSLDDQSIQQMMENLQFEKLCAVAKVGQKLQTNAEAKIAEYFRNNWVTIDETYRDFGINERNVKLFGSQIRNIRIQGWNFREREIATFVQSNFPNLKVIEFKFGSVIGRQLRNAFKAIDTIVFNTMHSDGNFCYHDDCLRYCESLRCLKYASFACDADEQDKFNAILSQEYSRLEIVHFDFQLEPNLNNWTRFMQRNTNITNLYIRFSNKDEKAILKIIKPIVDNAMNLRKLFLHFDFDARYGKVFNFATVHNHLRTLEQRKNFEYLGIYFSFFSTIRNCELIGSLGSLRSLVFSYPDPCDIFPEIFQYSQQLQKLHLHSAMNICPMGNHRNLETEWKDNFPNLEELHFWQVKNTYFLVSLFIQRSPKLKRIFAQSCKVVFDKNVAMSLKKFNDLRSAIGVVEPLIIYTDQKDVASNYDFRLVKLKHIEFEAIEFNEQNPFQMSIEGGIDSKFFVGEEKLKHLAMFENFENPLYDMAR